MYYQIETRDTYGEWSTDPLGDSDANRFDSEAEALSTIEDLLALRDPDWANGEYHVTAVEDE